jgi:mannosyltransferase
MAGPSTRRTIRLAVVLGVAGALISLIGSWIPSLWGDEAASVMSARRPLGSLFTMLAHVDAVHGLYYLALHVWIRMTGLSTFAERFPSAIAIGLTVAGVVWLTARFGSWRFAAVAGVFAAVMPQLTFAGEEVRPYAFDALIATVLAILVAEIMLRPDRARRLWIAYGVVLCVGIYTFLYLGLMIAAVGVVLWVTPAMRGQWRPWLKASGWAVLAAAPVIAFAIAERNQIAFLETRHIGPRALFVQMWFGRYLFAVPAWVLIGIAVAGFAVGVARARRAGRVLGPMLEPLALAWLVVPMGILVATTPVMAGFTPRYATLSAPAAAVIMALGVRRIVWFVRARRDGGRRGRDGRDRDDRRSRLGRAARAVRDEPLRLEPDRGDRLGEGAAGGRHRVRQDRAAFAAADHGDGHEPRRVPQRPRAHRAGAFRRQHAVERRGLHGRTCCPAGPVRRGGSRLDGGVPHRRRR